MVGPEVDCKPAPHVMNPPVSTLSPAPSLDPTPPSAGPDAAARWTAAAARLRRDGPFWLAFLGATVVSVAPLWTAAVPPLGSFATELPPAALLAAGDGSSLMATLELEAGAAGPVTGLWAALGGVLGLITAGKLLLTLAAVAVPLAAARWLAVAGRPRWFAFLAFPLAYNAELVGGQLSDALAIPLVVLALAELVAVHRRWSWARLAVVSPLAVAAGWLSPWLSMALVVGAAALVATLPARRLELLRLTLAAALATLGVLSGGLLGPALAVTVAPPVPAALDLFTRLGAETIEHWTGLFDDWSFVVLVGAIVSGLFWRSEAGRARLGRSPLAVEWTTGALAMALVASALGLWPAGRGSALDGLVPLVLLVGLGWLELPPGRLGRRGVPAAMVGLALVFPWSVRAAVDAFEAHELPPALVQLVDGLPTDARLAVLDEAGRAEVLRGAPRELLHAVHMALNGGLPSGAPDAGDSDGVRGRAEAAVPEVTGPAHRFMATQAACWYGYLLLGTRDTPSWGHLASRVTYLGHTGPWSLWRLEHARMPHCRSRPEWLPQLPSEPTDPREAQAAPAEPASAVQAPRPRRALPSRLGLRVGHARGRDLHDRYAPPEAPERSALPPRGAIP